MELKKRRSCGIYTDHQCPAIEGYGSSTKRCGLGFSVEVIKKPKFIMRPTEPCPRPRTLKEWCDLYDSIYNKTRKVKVG